MTTNQTIDGVPRELRALLERVVGKASQTPHWDALDEDRIAATAELRALLDGPVAAYAHDGGNNQKGDAPLLLVRLLKDSIRLETVAAALLPLRKPPSPKANRWRFREALICMANPSSETVR